MKKHGWALIRAWALNRDNTVILKRFLFCVQIFQVFWAIGTVMEVLLALVVMPTLGWRYLLFFSAIPVLIFILSCNVSDRSPYSLKVD